MEKDVSRKSIVKNVWVQIGLGVLVLAVGAFFVVASGEPDPETVEANPEGPIPEAATAAAQAAAYALQAANTAAASSKAAETSPAPDWERVAQAWEDVVRAWGDAESIIAYYTAEAAAARAEEITRTAVNQEVAHAGFLYEEARFAEDSAAAGESQAIQATAFAVGVAAEAALRASNSATEAAEYAEARRPQSAFESAREAADWSIAAARAAEVAEWQSSPEGIESLIAEATAAAEAAVAEAAEAAAAKEGAAREAARVAEEAAQAEVARVAEAAAAEKAAEEAAEKAAEELANILREELAKAAEAVAVAQQAAAKAAEAAAIVNDVFAAYYAASEVFHLTETVSTDRLVRGLERMQRIEGCPYACTTQGLLLGDLSPRTFSWSLTPPKQNTFWKTSYFSTWPNLQFYQALSVKR